MSAGLQLLLRMAPSPCRHLAWCRYALCPALPPPPPHVRLVRLPLCGCLAAHPVRLHPPACHRMRHALQRNAYVTILKITAMLLVRYPSACAAAPPHAGRHPVARVPTLLASHVSPCLRPLLHA